MTARKPRNVRAEVVEGSEQTMTDNLTPAELAALTKRVEDYPPSMTQSHWTQRELPALLAMARRLLELESALAFIEGGFRPVRCLLADEILKDARELGWKGLTP